MTIEERQPRGFRFYVVVVARWVAAFAAAAILYFGILAIGMKTIGFFRWLPVMATMAAITGGTFVFPSQHRNAGSLLLIALVIIAPLAVLLSHVSAGNASYGHSLMVIYNALGAMLTYQSMGSFPGVQRQSTQWWWLSYYSGLSKGQRSARRYLLFVGFAIGLLLYFLLLALANWRGVDSHLAVVAIVVTLPVGFLAARPLCGWLWPDMLQQADHDARLGLARVGPAFD